jgi:hypothetical protein
VRPRFGVMRGREKRTTNDPNADGIWNNNHMGYKSIIITQNDAIGNCVFECDIIN